MRRHIISNRFWDILEYLRDKSEWYHVRTSWPVVDHDSPNHSTCMSIGVMSHDAMWCHVWYCDVTSSRFWSLTCHIDVTSCNAMWQVLESVITRIPSLTCQIVVMSHAAVWRHVWRCDVTSRGSGVHHNVSNWCDDTWHPAWRYDVTSSQQLKLLIWRIKLM